MIKTLEWTDAGVRFIDQTKLPTEETYVTCKNYEEVADAIRTMIVRGAPAIGVAAAMGVALGTLQSQAKTLPELEREFDTICNVLAGTRPTAVNLFWAIRRMRDKFEQLRALPVEKIQAGVGGRGAAHAGGRHRRQRSHGQTRRGAAAQQRRRADALQCRRAGHRWIRHGAGRDSRRRGVGQTDPACSPTRRGRFCRGHV